MLVNRFGLAWPHGSKRKSRSSVTEPGKIGFKLGDESESSKSVSEPVFVSRLYFL